MMMVVLRITSSESSTNSVWNGGFWIRRLIRRPPRGNYYNLHLIELTENLISFSWFGSILVFLELLILTIFRHFNYLGFWGWERSNPSVEWFVFTSFFPDFSRGKKWVKVIRVEYFNAGLEVNFFFPLLIYFMQGFYATFWLNNINK